MNPQTLKIDNVEYVRKDSQQSLAATVDGMPYVVVRSKESGCHAGYLRKKRSTEVKLVRSRRLWYWDGAATLSQLATDGVKNASECTFPCEVNMIVLGVCEIIDVTEEARLSIQGVPVWKS